MSLELNPRKIEIELKKYLELWLRRAIRNKHFTLDDDAREALEHIVSRAFLAGKTKAAKELRSPWQIVGDDSRVIQETSKKFENDFTKIMREITTSTWIKEQIDWNEVNNRLKIIAQMLTWTSYSLGKKSEFKRSLKTDRFTAQRYKYQDYFMFQTQADELVCSICAPHAGNRSLDYDEMTMLIGGDPPLHIYCRCEIVAIPTVPVVERQDRFRERREREEEEE